MSWKNQIENTAFQITTGDGKDFFPLWKTRGKDVEFNAAIYDFIDVEGSQVDRKKSKSGKHTLEFYFQGDNNIVESIEFDNSAKDSRAWSVVHPFYGIIKGQPLSIVYNNDNLNITIISVDFWESINADYPDSQISVKDSVEAKKINVLNTSALVFESDIQPTTADISKIKESNLQTSSAFNNSVTDLNNADYSNAVAKSISAADNLLTNPLSTIESSQAILDLPATFDAAVASKISSFISAYETLKSAIESVPDKLFFESQAAALIASLCNCAVNPAEDDYVIRTEIESVVEQIFMVYNDYVSVLDDNQVQIYDVENTYIPNVETQTQLLNLVAFTTSNLYNFAFEAKQLRIVYAEKNTNPILLTHRYLGGLDAADAKLDAFIKINNIKLKELFFIKKGREIKYFV